MHSDTMYALLLLLLTLLQWGYLGFLWTKTEEKRKENERIRKAALQKSIEDVLKMKQQEQEEAERKAVERKEAQWKFLWMVGMPLLIVSILWAYFAPRPRMLPV